MDRSAFEAETLGEGYDIREAEIAPDQHRPPHTHPFDAKLFILEGSLTLVRGGVAQAFGPGTACFVPAGETHEEITDARGVRYVAGRRTRAAAAA